MGIPLSALLAADQADQLEAVHHRHVDVDQRDVEVVAGHLAQPVHAVLRLHDLDVLEALQANTSSWRMVGLSSTIRMR
jgi:hypothetical protein